MKLGLAGRVAIVTGASKGIDLAVTRALAEEGVRVVAGARTASSELAAVTGAVRHVPVDLSTPTGPAELVSAALELGRLDPVVIDYSAAKAALTNFGKSLSKEVGPKGIRVNTISPGPVATDLWLGPTGVAATVAKQLGGDPHAVAAGAAAESVTGRFTQPHEIADLVLLLASDRAGNLTGADITIDGGLITTL